MPAAFVRLGLCLLRHERKVDRRPCRFRDDSNTLLGQRGFTLAPRTDILEIRWPAILGTRKKQQNKKQNLLSLKKFDVREFSLSLGVTRLLGAPSQARVAAKILGVEVPCARCRGPHGDRMSADIERWLVIKLASMSESDAERLSVFSSHPDGGTRQREQQHSTSSASTSGLDLSLCRLLDPEVAGRPLSLFAAVFGRKTRCIGNTYLHSWVVTRYDDVVRIARFFGRTYATPRQLTAMDLSG